MKENVYCPLLKKQISEGYCFDLSNIAINDILLQEDKDKIMSWENAQKICKECGRYED